ncbi:DoxX family protein [Micromonospora sp. NPDC049523]|uniref:DoxX family protein n=1 Tax=Micromonospora sp. NPDC049523 TaxID=3155921 RepID=UPI0034134676
MSLGLLLLRLLLAALLFGHATQKLFGWFRGQGPTGTGAIFHGWGVRPGPQMAVLAGTAELVGAALIALGLLTPLGAAIVIGTMTVAAAVNVSNGFWAHLGGYEVAFVYAALAAVLAYTGPGAWSLDNPLGLGDLAGCGWGTAAVAVGLLGSVPPLLRRRQVLASEQ